MLTHVHTANVIVSDQQRALDFYVDVLGFSTREDVELPGMRWLTVEIPGARTGLSLETDALHPGAKPGGHTGISIVTDDIDADHRRMSAAGVTFTQPVQREPWGARATFFEDLDGNLFYLIQPDRPAGQPTG